MRPEALINVQVTPRSRRDEIAGWQNGVLRVRLKAPPVEGRANDALCRFLASLLGVAASGVEVMGGRTERSKRVRVVGLTAEEVRAKLGA